MRIKKSISKNSTSYSVIKDVVVNGKKTTKIVEALGNDKEILAKYPDVDPFEWAKEYAKKLTDEENKGISTIIKKFNHSNLIDPEKQVSFNVGYLFLMKIYHSLKLDKICEVISNKYRFKFDLNEILSLLIFTRVLFPSSKKSSFEQAEFLLDFNPSFEIHDIYRALEIFAKESDFIESEVYKNSLNIIPRNTNVLYYDCTNFYFEIEEAIGLRQYGVSKENRPNPIVQFGLFMDGSGLPLGFCLNQGNTNEQVTLKPLEKRILNDFNLSRFVVCTDSGLSSISNRKFNTYGARGYVTSQPLKKLKSHLKNWALDPYGWHIIGSSSKVDLSKIDLLENDNIYYKERWINENGIEEKLFVSFSPKQYRYQRCVRKKQIDRAIKKIESPSSLKRVSQTDPKRFIRSEHFTENGEIADRSIFNLDEDVIRKENMFDGFYAVCSNLDFSPSDIIRINKSRWEIEESFRIMKSDFQSRPVFVQRDERISAHFLTCFLSLLVYRILEKLTNEEVTSSAMISTLKGMNVMKYEDDGYIPLYKRTGITDLLHETFSFRTDTEIISQKSMKKILKSIKKAK